MQLLFQGLGRTQGIEGRQGLGSVEAGRWKWDEEAAKRRATCDKFPAKDTTSRRLAAFLDMSSLTNSWTVSAKVRCCDC